MTKVEFLAQLRKRLSSLPRKDRKERLNFYSEIIDDRMEEGLSEEEAIAAICQEEDLPPEAPRKKRRAWETVLLILGSPVWLSLLIAALAVVFALWVCLWALILCLWVTFGALLLSALACVILGIIQFCSGNVYAGFAALGAGFICVGLGILLFFLCKAATKGGAKLTKFIVKKRRNRHA